MTPWFRFVWFNAVGAAGIGVQLGAVWLLTGVAHLHYAPATSAAVALAVVHNFAWHRSWTWGDRADAGRTAALFLRFAAANGVLSLCGNLAIMAALVSCARLPAVAANAVAIAVIGLANFWIGDAVVFRRPKNVDDQVVRAAGAAVACARSRWNRRQW